MSKHMEQDAALGVPWHAASVDGELLKFGTLCIGPFQMLQKHREFSTKQGGWLMLEQEHLAERGIGTNVPEEFAGTARLVHMEGEMVLVAVRCYEEGRSYGPSMWTNGTPPKKNQGPTSPIHPDLLAWFSGLQD